MARMKTLVDDSDRLLDVDAVADLLGISRQTVYMWRTRGAGPRGIKVGGRVRYRRSEVDKWIDQRSDPA